MATSFKKYISNSVNYNHGRRMSKVNRFTGEYESTHSVGVVGIFVIFALIILFFIQYMLAWLNW